MNWIKVSDQLPPDGSAVLVWYIRDEIGPCWLIWSATSTTQMHDDFKRLGFSHWMHIDPPK